MSYERLIAEHERIDEAFYILCRIVQSEPDVAAAAAALSTVAIELRNHIAHEDSFLYAAIARERAPLADTAEGFITEFAQLRADWIVYVQDWDTDCIAADWPAFRQETLAMAARLAQRVERENDMLYPQALQHSGITLRERYAA